MDRVGRRRRWLWRSGVVLLLAGLAMAVTPVPRFDAPLGTVLWSKEGRLLGATIAADEQWRFPPRRTVPEKYAAALLQFEDRRFRYHVGVDPVAVVRAFVQNLVEGRVVSGASTLTMQTVRLARGDASHTVVQKVIQAWLAVRLELSTGKDQIMAMYASNAPFGGNVVGLDAAAFRYFGRSAESLSWAEAATLAVLPNNPALLHPGRHRRALQDKRNRLLRSLHEAGRIDAETLTLAEEEDLPPRPLPLPRLAPQLLARAVQEHPGSVYSTLDARLQRRVAAIVDRHAALLAGNHVHNAAAIVLDTRTGAVLAYVGNATPAGKEHEGDVDVVAAERSTGSVLKPFLYAGMMERGELMPQELVPDIPTRIAGFAPENFDHGFDGAVPAAEALARSLNVPAVRLLYRHGVEVFFDELRAVGLTTLHRTAENYGLSLVLGGAEGSLWELASAYAAIGRRAMGDGAPVFPAHYLSRASLPDATLRPAPTRAPFGAGAAYSTLQALTRVRRPGAERAWRQYAGAQPISWKTGTSFGFRDAWSFGVTPNVTVGVWVGNATGVGRPGVVGVHVAAPILFEIFDGLDGGGSFEPPAGEMVDVEICAHSGLRAGPDCADVRRASVPATAVGGDVCRYCQRMHVVASLPPSGVERVERVHAGCAAVAEMEARSVFVLPASMAGYYRQSHGDYQGAPPWRADCVAGSGEDVHGDMALIYPKEGSEIFIPKELDGERGRAVFRAQHMQAGATIYWHLDNHYLGATKDFYELEVLAAPGEHTLTLVDGSGSRLQRRFEVLTTDP